MTGIQDRKVTQRGNDGNQLELGQDYNTEESWKQEASFLDETGLNKDVREKAGLEDGEETANFMEDIAGEDGIVGKGDLAQFETDGKMDSEKVKKYLDHQKELDRISGGMPNPPSPDAPA